MHKTIALALMALLLTIPGTLSGAAEEKDHVCFRVLDSDGNGVVTMQEFETIYGKDGETFSKADADNDGTLTHDEYHVIVGHGASQN